MDRPTAQLVATSLIPRITHERSEGKHTTRKTPERHNDWKRGKTLLPINGVPTTGVRLDLGLLVLVCHHDLLLMDISLQLYEISQWRTCIYFHRISR